MDTRLEVKATMRRHLTGNLAAPNVATPDVSAKRLYKAAAPDEIKELRVWELREVLPRLMRADADAALAFVADVLGLDAAGLLLSKAPHIRSSSDVQREVLEAVGAAGHLAASLIHGSEEERQEAAAVAVREACEAKAALACGSPQMVMGAVR